MTIRSTLLTFTALVLAFSPMAASAKTINDKPFVHFYLDCEGNRAEAMNKALKDLPCVQKVAVHYCSIYDGLPKDVQTSLSLELYCNFVAGEQNGDAEHDAKLMEAVEKAGCFKGTEDRKKLAAKYEKSPDELDALQNFTTKLMEQEAACEIPIEHRRAKQAVSDEIKNNAPKTTSAKKYESRKTATNPAPAAEASAPVKTEEPKTEAPKTDATDKAKE